MFTYISASKIYPVSAAPIDHGLLALNPDGTIVAIYTAAEAAALQITPDHTYDGVLVPGFVNTHCHLELSHLKGCITPHTGLIKFVGQVMSTRAAEASDIQRAMEEADQEMFDAGIVAVGDISNLSLSKGVKVESRLYYQTFIEAMGFNPLQAAGIIERAKALQAEFAPLAAAIVPHAPYSVSDPLMAAIASLNTGADALISIHNQESPAENEFFQTKTGTFLGLYEFLGLDLDFYEAPGISALQATLPKLPKAKVLLVHNTTTTQEDLDFAARADQQLFWCLCPNANLYIENSLPDVRMFQAAGLKITLGTDSLASNHQLSILKEMQTLQEHKQIDFVTLLAWATLNGAEFLGVDRQYGSFEVGKAPGILCLTQLGEGKITDQTILTRLF
jgi:cytosine/adenosine deaminase-related metal-dependent hydrolase